MLLIKLFLNKKFGIVSHRILVKLLCFGLTVLTHAISSAQTVENKTQVGVASNRVDACKSAIDLASAYNTNDDSIHAIVSGRGRRVEVGTCDCAIDPSSPGESWRWKCLVIIKIAKIPPLTLTPTHRAPIGDDTQTRQDSAFGSTQVDACVSAKDLSSTIARSAGAEVFGFGTCYCSNNAFATSDRRWQCGVETSYRVKLNAGRTLGL